jgi:1-acyl-sn-glycerol-3-phosphate acyltransferase
MLQQQVRAHLERHPTGVIVYFPEGTTSGKPNESDPYHLARFKRGAYAVAHNLQITRVLVAQFFDPRIGLRAKVLDVGQVPYSSEDSHCVCGDFAARDQVRMQAYLDAMLEQVHPEVLGMRPIS